MQSGARVQSGVDFVGICRANPGLFTPPTSRRIKGTIHEFAVVYAYRPGLRNMEGASGDD